jgi:hypothetical protein
LRLQMVSVQPRRRLCLEPCARRFRGTVQPRWRRGGASCPPRRWICTRGGKGASEFAFVELVCRQRRGVVIPLCSHRLRSSAGAPLKSTPLQRMCHALPNTVSGPSAKTCCGHGFWTRMRKLFVDTVSGPSAKTCCGHRCWAQVRILFVDTVSGPSAKTCCGHGFWARALFAGTISGPSAKTP